MARELQTLARKALRKLGLQKIRYPSAPEWIIREGFTTVLDVGANEGQYARELREYGYRGHIVSFEPVSDVFEVLNANAANDPLWSVYQLGLGDKDGQLPILVTEGSIFSSFKHPNEYAANRFVGTRITAQEKVPVRRLDAFLAEHPQKPESTLLKIDTQGYEHEVLAGAGDWLKELRAIQIEVALRPMYEGQETLVEAVQWMLDRGFEIAFVKENGFDWPEYRHVELDVIFARASSAN